MKKLILFVLALSLSLTLILPAAARSSAVQDKGRLLSGAEEEKIAAACSGADVGMSFYVLLVNDFPGTPSAGLGRTTFSIDQDESAVVLVVRLHGGTYYYDMYTYGRATNAFSNADVDRILDDPDVYDNIKGGELAEGCLAFVELCREVAAKQYAADQAAARKKEQNAIRSALLVGAIAGSVVGSITVLCVFLFYRKKRRGVSYPLDRYAQLQLTNCQDIFVGSFVTRTRVQSSSSSGGRSGGGGGHRGGR